MAVLESNAHPVTIRTGTEKWGCNNRVWADGYWVWVREYQQHSWWQHVRDVILRIFDTAPGGYIIVPKFIKHTMSTECRQANTMIDVRCDGCRERGLGDAYVEKIRREGK